MQTPVEKTSRTKRNTKGNENPLVRVAIDGDSRNDVVGHTVVTISEYRKLLKDTTSTDKQITDRLRYLESLCRNVIREELQNYVDA